MKQAHTNDATQHSIAKMPAIEQIFSAKKAESTYLGQCGRNEPVEK